jgi:hypothetical protein
VSSKKSCASCAADPSFLISCVAADAGRTHGHHLVAGGQRLGTHGDTEGVGLELNDLLLQLTARNFVASLRLL